MQLHLPLSPVDTKNQPPLYYLQVQDGLILLQSVLWTIAYILYVRQGFIDSSYGMPIVCLCANIAWEFLFGLVVPVSAAQTVAFVPWLIIDIGIVYTTWKYGKHQWKSSPKIANNLGIILTFGIWFMIVCFWCLIKTIGLNASSFYLGYGLQLLIGTSSVAQLLSRNNTSGHSWGIWFTRATGTFFTIVLFGWRYAHYPDSYPRVAEPMTLFLFGTSELFDVIYPFVYYCVDGTKKDKTKRG
ncbi:hypothetical protein B0I35DRAFT_436133 [Stachybotrys elegans]|uniref:Integral membrane protein n=1 Tax=Stachybotrys elegans TaxID=80388 RepID=A0A8K0WQ21_9HYPO|nr:hypothetical protein B0I35DRAFT_436133 [Stachybotrys elegans]